MERIALKVIGVLNLVSTSGLTRASQGLVVAALSAALPKTSTGEKFELLQALQDKGLITYREYSDEYRIWQGSDYDLRASVELAKTAYRNRGLAALLREAVELDPQVAGRSSQKHGTLRLF